MASVDGQNVEEVQKLKGQIRQVIKHLTPSSEPRASIESSQHTMQCVFPGSDARNEPLAPTAIATDVP